MLSRNLAALEVRQNETAVRLRSTRPRELRIVRSRSGHPIPELVGGGGSTEALHSRYDPIREAHRLPQFADQSAGFFAFLGLGAGYHIREFLNRHTTTGAWIVESDADLARAVMEQVDLTPILADARTTLLVGEPVAAAASKLPAAYLPAIDGNLHTVNLSSLTRVRPNYFRDLIAHLQRVMEQVAVDYTTQATFGGRWFANILANLPRVEQAARRPRPISTARGRALVVGAGPGAEQAGERLRAGEQADSDTVIACDSALPVLAGAGISPDYAVTVDCQHFSYHHWLALGHAGGNDVTTIVDVASPPAVTRLAANPVFFASGHPMTQYLAQHWVGLPALPTVGGNVGYAAVAFALSMGFENVDVIGLDYAYPGKRYARGADVYTPMSRAQSRRGPVEHQDLAAILRAHPRRQRTAEGLVYETAQMSRYRHALSSLVSGGVATPAPGIWQSARAPSTSWQRILRDLSARLQLLPPAHLPLRSYLDALTREQRDLITIMLPAAASLHERPSRPYRNAIDVADAAALVEDTRAWSLRLIERTIRHGED